MATYNAIKYNVDYGGFAGNLIPISTFTSDGSDANATFNSSLITLSLSKFCSRMTVYNQFECFIYSILKGF